MGDDGGGVASDLRFDLLDRFGQMTLLVLGTAQLLLFRRVGKRKKEEEGGKKKGKERRKVQMRSTRQ